MKTQPRLRLIARALLLAGLGAAGSAQAAINCNVSGTSVNGIYTRTANLNLVGSITVNCTRTSGDPTSQVVYIGIDGGEGANARDMTRQTGTELLRYAIYRNSSYAGQWTEGTGRAPGNTSNGGLIVTMSFGSGTTASQSYAYYLRVNSGITRAAGIYDDQALGLTLRQTNANGAVMATGTFGVTASIIDECYFNTTPSAIVLNYPAFSASAVTGNSSFQISCTQSTDYTLALNSATGTLLGLNFSLALSAASGVGTGFVQTYGVTATVPAGQAGTCSLATCNATATRTVTVTY